MSTLSDARREALEAQGFTGALPEMTLQWLQSNGATSDQLSDAWMEMLVILGDVGPEPLQDNSRQQRNDLWYELLGRLAYIGALPDREAAFWAAGGSFWPAVPQADWTIEQNGNDYGYGPGYGGLAPATIGGVTITDLYADSLSDVVTLVFDTPVFLNEIALVADGIGLVYLEPQSDTVFSATDAAFTAGVVAAVNTSVSIALMPGIIVRPPVWTSDIPNFTRSHGEVIEYNVQVHVGFNPYIEVTGYAIGPGAPAGVSIDNNGNLTVDGSQAPGSYPLTVIASNIVGGTASNEFVVEYRVDPVIDVQPQDQTALEPGGAVFTVGASHPAAAQLFYSWELTRELDTGPRNLPILQVNSTELQDNGTQVRVTVIAYSRLSQYRVVSEWATLTVEEATGAWPVIEQHPESLVVTEPTGGQFVMVASHPDSAPLIYQWQVLQGAAWIDAGDYLDLDAAGDDNPVMILATTAADQNNTIVRGRVRAYTDDPNYEVYTNLALLSVSALVLSPPTITDQPQDLRLVEGESGIFFCDASHPDNATLLFQWEHSFINASGANTRTLTVDDVALQEDGLQTRCRVRAYNNSGDYQVFSDFATLEVWDGRVPPVIDDQPDDLTILEGDGGQFTVVASHPDGAPLFYLWQCEHIDTGTWITADDDGGLSSVVGVSTETMTLTSSDRTDSREVRVQVRAYEINSDQIVTSDPATLIVQPDADTPIWGVVDDLPFRDTDLPEQVDMNDFLLGGTELEGWALSGNPPGITIDANGIVTVADTTPPDTYTMTCFVENILGGSTSEPFDWQVRTLPVIDTQPSPESIIEPQGGGFSIVVSTVEAGVPLFYWWEATDDGGSTWNGLAGLLSDTGAGNQAAFLINSTNGDDTSITPLTVRCVVQAYFVADPEEPDNYRVFSSPVPLEIDRVDPVIDTQPVDATVTEDEATSFAVQASHPAGASLFYEWQDTFVSSVSGRATATLNVNSAHIDDDGKQTLCRVRAYESGNSAQEVNSNPATMTVELGLLPPAWSPIPDDSVHIDDADSYSRDMNDFVDSEAPLRNWTTTFGTISAAGILTVPAGLDAGDYPSRQTVENDAGVAQGDEWTLTVEAGPPIWNTIPNFSGGVDDQLSFTFNANDYVDPNGGEITEWASLNGNVNVTPGGVVTANMASSGNYQEAIIATNAYGSSQSAPYSYTLTPVTLIDHVFTAANGFVGGQMLGGQQGWSGVEGTSFYVDTSSGGHINIPVGEQGSSLGLNTYNLPNGLDFELTVVTHNSYIDDAGEDNCTISIGGQSLNIDPRATYAVSDLGGEARVNGSVSGGLTLIMRRSGGTLTFTRGGSSPTTPCTPGEGYALMTLTGSQLGSILPRIVGLKSLKLELI